MEIANAAIVIAAISFHDRSSAIMAGFNGRSGWPRRLSAGSASGNDLGVLLISNYFGIAIVHLLAMGERAARLEYL